MDPNTIWPFLFDVSDVLASTIDAATGTLTLQLGDVTKDRPDTSKAEAWQGASGICARPALPTQGKASCQVFHLKRSDHDVGFAYRDLRATSILGNMAPGDTCLFATSGAARALCKAKDGSARLYTTDNNKDGGNSVYAGVSSYWNSPSGPALGGEWRVFAPWGSQLHDPSGFHVRARGGAKLDLGIIGLASPFNTFGSYATISADMVRLDGAGVTLGRGTALALVQATPLAGIMATLATALGTVQLQLGLAATGLTAGATGPGAPTLATLAAANTNAAAALTLAANALSAAISALGTIKAATATKSTTAA